MRSLVAFRVGLGLIVIIDLLGRMRDLRAHYTADGVFPLDALLTLGTHATIAFHNWNDTALYQASLFCVHMIFALLLLLGWHTKIMSILVWALMISVHNRNFMILHGGDVLLRLLLFWAMFLPLSEESRRFARGKDQQSYLGFASVFYALQVALLYWSAAWLKSDRAWWPDGNAVWLALNLDHLATAFGVWLRGFGEHLRWLSISVLALEYTGPFLLLAPWAWIRFFGVVLLAGMQMGFGLGLDLALFPWISVLATVPFLPREFWDLLDRRFARLRGLRVLRPKRLLTKIPPRIDQIAKACVTGALVYVACIVLWINLKHDKIIHKPIPDILSKTASYLRIDQYWNMFAPFPYLDDFWFVIPARLANGTEVDLFRNGRTKISWAKPELVSAEMENVRWAKFLANMWDSKHIQRRVWYTEYLCRDWNRRHGPDEQIDILSVYYVRETARRDYTVADPVPVKMLTHRCERS
jgi:hypothetical protein